MFGHNEIWGSKHFDKDEKSETRLLVTSIFRTLQGEGPYAGRPAVFIRLAKCNLACSFCDTFFDAGSWLTILELLGRITSLLDCNPSADLHTYRHKRAFVTLPELIVITGGEPMLQSKMLTKFLYYLKDHFETIVQIETNGILRPNPKDLLHADELEDVCLVVSPKASRDTLASHSGNWQLHPPPPRAVLERADFLKLLIASDMNSPYYDVPGWALEWARARGNNVYLSPIAVYNRPPDALRRLYEAGVSMSTIESRSGDSEVASVWEDGLLDKDACRRNHARAAELAILYNLKLSLQMQLFAALP